uniref:Uncharacterized protein n=1 Tax=Tetradesmus obliquus TaxID=3088 RepID=A0A383W1I3_TETOB
MNLQPKDIHQELGGTSAAEAKGAEEDAMRMLSAFDAALEHPALSADPGVLCAAARSYKAWRDAVQQCRARNTAVVFDYKATPQRLAALASGCPGMLRL